MSTLWKWPGSRWWRVDLHTHSPASYDFHLGEDHANRDWARWVQAAKDAGLDAVAVTDHNCADGIDAIKAAASTVTGAPIVLPGVEVTASCGTHLLVIFDPSATSAHVNDFLARVRVKVAARGTREARSPMSVESILEHIDPSRELLIAAHVNREHGLFVHNGQQRLRELGHSNLLAVEVVPPVEPEVEVWLDGSRPEVGRSIPQLWCSDAHEFRQLGRRFTWVKMGEPDREGLRLAFLDGNSSLRPDSSEALQNPNRPADLVIKSLRVANARYMGRGQPLELSFNPWLNAIIGGRGTGKSTLLDFIRKVLRRENDLPDSLREAFDRRVKVPRSRSDEGLLTEETRLELVCRKNGREFCLRWDPQGTSPAIVRLEDGEQHPDEGDIRERFPVRIYSQKELFELAQNPNALLRVLDETPEVQGRQRWQRISAARDRYLSLCALARGARANASDLAHRRAALRDIKAKLEILQNSDGARTFATYRFLTQQNSAWQSIVAGVVTGLDGLEGASAELLVADLPPGPSGEDSESHRALQSQHERLSQIINRLRERIAECIESARTEVNGLSETPEAHTWQAALAASESAYQKVARELEGSGISSPDEYRNLLDLAALCEREIRDLEEEHKRATAFERSAAQELATYRSLLGELTEARQGFAKRAVSSFLRIEVLSHGDSAPEKLVSAMREILRIERFDADLEELAKRLRSEDKWNFEGLDSLVADLRRLADDENAAGPWNGHFRRALRRLTPDQVDRLALYAPEDALSVSFPDPKNSKNWQALAQGSPGQQTAALLGFVLGYGNEPILLDQPEDDLDNKLIYDLVVQRLRESKSSRQIIVVTHNPNIVVHGDAELVIALDTLEGRTRITCQGSLQARAIRDEVCKVLEGGRQAFEARYRRILDPGSAP